MWREKETAEEMKLSEFYDIIEDWKNPCEWIEDRGCIPVPKTSGVYMICWRGHINKYSILYVGSSKCLKQRKSGHPVLSMLKHFYKNLEFYYYETKNYKQLEKELIIRFRPEFNNHWN